LRTGETRAASRLELFFDLAYVLAIAELARTLIDDLSWSGVAAAAALFVIVWLSWVSFTLYANRFDTDDVGFRFAKFAAMAAILGGAASISEATADQAAVFAASYFAGRLVLVALYARAWRHVQDARGTVGVYLVAMSIVAALWAASVLVPSPSRFGLWGLAVVIDVAAPLVASHRPGRAPLHLEHLPDRFALLVILVLGEFIAAIVTGVHETKWAGVSVLVALAGFVVAAACWWVYFDVSGAVSSRALQRAEEQEEERRAEQDTTEQEEAVDQRHDFFVFGHLPLTGGIVAAAVGLEELVLHPATRVPSNGTWLVAGGLATFAVGAALVQGGSQQRAMAALVWPGVLVPVVLVLGATPVSPLSFALLLALALTAGAAVGTTLSRRRTAASPSA
jgi:low temperature requirement protein LtrA